MRSARGLTARRREMARMAASRKTGPARKATAAAIPAQKKSMGVKATGGQQPAPAKKLGLESSATRTALVDTTERLIREQGFAAITSRIIAAEAGLKPQLIHYYFKGMDDLYIEVFRRGADADLERLRAALDSNKPLQAMWKLSTDPKSARFATEFITMANHNDAVRAEIGRYAKKRRELQVEIVTRHLAARGQKPRIPPVVTAMVIESVARGRLLESALGLSLGHAELDGIVKTYLRVLENGGDILTELEGSILQERPPRGRSKPEPAAKTASKRAARPRA
jgi:AcrR family transcriptional regulator